MKTADKFREKHIFNAWEILKRFAPKGMDVACNFSKREPRACQPPCTRVWSPSHKTDPKAHWSDYGQKSFTGNRAESMPQAIAWASERYGITEWATSPFSPSEKIPKVAMDAALKFLKEGQ